MQDARQSPRLSVNCPVSFVIENVAGTGTIYNLSERGCAIESDVAVPQEGYASLTITIPGMPDQLVVELARVCWMTRREFGLEFRVITRSARKRIERYLFRSQAA
ncbi:PilZ domain-containing protein [Nitrospira sp. NS4]|uniref:PilZ domain-containing protein n=1 Tax=Nitrospira sp. NS4 TaxID=3414498 RepID=UPI003C2FB6B0